MKKEHKVVINLCYGGFSLSLKCVEFMHSHGGLTDAEYEEYWKIIDDWASIGGDTTWIAWYINKEKGDRGWIERGKNYCTREKFEEEMEDLRNNGYICVERTKESVRSNIDVFNRLVNLMYYGPRHNKSLVEAVETLGSEECSGSCAKLGIHSIYGKIYKISDYDGLENVECLDDGDVFVIDED